MCTGPVNGSPQLQTVTAHAKPNTPTTSASPPPRIARRIARHDYDRRRVLAARAKLVSAEELKRKRLCAVMYSLPDRPLRGPRQRDRILDLGPGSSPWVGPSARVSARDVLDRLVDRIRSSNHADPVEQVDELGKNEDALQTRDDNPVRPCGVQASWRVLRVFGQAEQQKPRGIGERICGRRRVVWRRRLRGSLSNSGGQPAMVAFVSAWCRQRVFMMSRLGLSGW